jgi:hypothetical protein
MAFKTKRPRNRQERQEMAIHNYKELGKAFREGGDKDLEAAALKLALALEADQGEDTKKKPAKRSLLGGRSVASTRSRNRWRRWRDIHVGGSMCLCSYLNKYPG